MFQNVAYRATVYRTGAKALVLVIPTEAEIFYQDLYAKALVFVHSYRNGNILPRFVRKSPSFGHSYRSRNILPRFVSKSPLFLIEQINPLPVTAKQKYKITV